jgi:hypothetical protein
MRTKGTFGRRAITRTAVTRAHASYRRILQEGQRRADVTRGQGAGRLRGGHLTRRVLEE